MERIFSLRLRPSWFSSTRQNCHAGVIPDGLSDDWFCPESCGERSDAVGRFHELVPSVLARIEDGFVSFPYAMTEPIAAQELPDIFHTGSSTMLSGTWSRGELCQPAPSSTSTAIAPTDTRRLISAKCSFMASTFTS